MDAKIEQHRAQSVTNALSMDRASPEPTPYYYYYCYYYYYYIVLQFIYISQNQYKMVWPRQLGFIIIIIIIIIIITEY